MHNDKTRNGAPIVNNRKDLTETDSNQECRRIWKNIIIVGICYMLLFTAFVAMQRLQSSLFRDDGMGVITQAVLSGCYALSSLVFTKPLIGEVGHKWSMVVAFIAYIIWTASNGYAIWETMVTSSVIAGLGAGPIWIARGSYVSKMAKKYASLSGQNESDVVSKFFGAFFGIWGLSNIVGPLVSSLVLKKQTVNETEDNDTSRFCGYYDCPWDNDTTPNFMMPDDNTLWTMLGSYLGVAFIALLLLILTVDRLPPELRDPRMTRQELGENFISVFKLMVTPTQLLLTPMTLYVGLQHSFPMADLNKSYVSCSIGVWMVGYTTVPYGLLAILTSVGGGYLAKYTHRMFIFIVGYVFHIAAVFTMIVWYPVPQESYVLYILSGMWGVGDGCIRTQCNALYGHLYGSKTNDSAFANSYLWIALGTLIIYAFSSTVCTSVTLYVMLVMLFLSLACYMAVEWRKYKENNNIVANSERGMKSMDKNNTLSMAPEPQTGKQIPKYSVTTTEIGSLATQVGNSKIPLVT